MRRHIVFSRTLADLRISVTSLSARPRPRRRAAARRRLTIVVALAVLCLTAALGGSIPTAGAQIVHLKSGRNLILTPRLTPAQVQALYQRLRSRLAASSASPSAAAATQHFTASYESIVDQFLRDVGTDSNTTGNVYAVSAQYGAGATSSGSYQSSFGRQFSDTSAFPTGGCTPAQGYTACVTDAQVQTELNKVVSAHSLPTDLTAEYFVMLPAGVDECDGTGSCADSAYCAYHSNAGTGQSGALYSVMPYAGVQGCEGGESPNQDVGADAEVSILSHEHNETITDPYGTSWYDATQGNEIGDKCAYLFGSPVGGASGAQYNQVIAGDHYWLQDEFANKDGLNAVFDSCEQHPGATADGVSTAVSPPPDSTPLVYHNGPVLGAHTTYTIFWDPGNSASPPDPSFTPSATSTTTNTAVTFTPTTTTDPQGGTLAYAWTFGDGGSTSVASPQHTYCAPGTYQVHLKVSDPAGYFATSTQTLTVTGGQVPCAHFTATPNPVGAVNSVAFDGSSSTPAQGSIGSYSWTFGDGTTATGATASHSYGTPGTYTTTLTVTDGGSSPGSTTQTITVVGPTAAFSATPAVAGSPSSFTAGSSSPDPISSYVWDFGDGTGATTSTNQTSHTYTQAGPYTVKLITKDSAGNASGTTSHTITVPGPTVSFSSSPAPPGQASSFTASSSAADPVTSYSWNFGDPNSATANTASGATAGHTYTRPGTYTVTLTGTDAGGNSAAPVSHTVSIPGPSAAFSVTPAPPGQATAFTAGQSPDPITSYAWSFGDGTPAGTGAAPGHTYAQAGAYTVTLTTADSQGNQATTTQTVTISALTAGFTSTPAPVVAGTPEAFSAAPSADPIASYSWSFGDGTPAAGGATPSHTFAQPGTYTVTLTVTDAHGFTAHTSTQLAVVPLTASFAASPAAPVAGQALTFSPAASGDPVATYRWDFGDGTASTDSAPTHTYAQAGTYTVSLTVTDANGHSVVASTPITVATPPPAPTVTQTQPQTTPTTPTQTAPASNTPLLAQAAAALVTASPSTATVKRVSSALVLRGGYLLGCPAQARAACRATVVLTTTQRSGRGRHAKTLTVILGSATVVVAPGGQLAVSLPLSSSGAALLTRSHRLAAQLAVSALTGSTRVPTASRSLTLNAPAPAKSTKKH